MRICTIGGGSGMPIVNKSLVKAGFDNISSIVTTFDSGGDSGRMRTDERGRILAFSDYWRSLISLWKDGEQKEKWEEILRFRDGRGRNFGNLFFQFMAEKAGNLSEVDNLFAKLTGANLVGRVIPVSTEPANVCFRTRSKKIYVGEHFLDDMRMSEDKVELIWLEPKVFVNPEVIEVLKTADLIIISPGSMYGSVITNFLPKGMIDAYNKSKAKKILITNLMSVANENNGFCQKDYFSIFEKYLKTKSPYDGVLMADFSKLDPKKMAKVLGFYKLEHSFPIKYEKDNLVKVWLEDVAKIEEKSNTLRHSEEKLAKFFKSFVF